MQVVASSRAADQASRYPSWRAQYQVRGQPVPGVTASPSSFDHLAGAGEQRQRHTESRRLGRLEIDHSSNLAPLQSCNPSLGSGSPAANPLNIAIRRVRSNGWPIALRAAKPTRPRAGKELASLQSRTSFARATNVSDKEMPNDAAVLRLTAI